MADAREQRPLARTRHFAVALFLASLSLPVAAIVQGPSVLSIDPVASRMTIEVGRTGVFGFAGHNHEVVAPVMHGTVTYDASNWAHSSVKLECDATALKVTGKGDPPSDVPKVQAAMLSEEVLDAKRFPRVTFVSRKVSPAGVTAGAVSLLIDGDITLHGQTRPLSVRVTAAPGPDGLVVRGGFPLKQTDFGIEPVTAAAGAVRVKDEVQVQFVLEARRTR